ncbi:TrsD/TraD family conjugative transfer protein [Bacillus atrophaeus]|uniref:TrsD/TraD family conjugative transfer protein n=2 Tax=Bacillus atrophaeus TaxID=1452 RepID=UPI002280F05B|nr:TrsD/TraD family conjugative transfer protein [Bacillus atrophaeus]MCY8497754.1 conjugal transfer protein [Bacillus atrophaeus]MCY8814941.1 conjugal transfer protein [Bacillus atrophaeus]MCY8821557.1 conjugal transfer protein [Bacillus atrophaeus]MCY8830987.1 conjugal transfer protein [Bacillus atrophaeus]MCY8835246.1 conjugal transfer protein [Bacillus atrophaeus]
MFFTKKKSDVNYDDFDFQPKELQKGQKTLQEMSIIQGQYQEYIVTKTGYLVTILSGTGVNLDLLNEYEQTDIFEEYNAFLMANVAEARGEVFQFLDMTIPVDFKPYILSWKKRYIEVKEEEPENELVRQLVASYIDHYEQEDAKHEMTTQGHFVVLKEKIKDKNYKSLQLAEKNLDEKAKNAKKSLETQFQHYDLLLRKMNAAECKRVLYLFMNFNQS